MAGPSPMRLVFSNAANPLRGQGTKVPPLGRFWPLGDLMSPRMPSAPPTGKLWVFRGVRLTGTAGPQPHFRWAFLFTFPFDPTGGGDGPLLGSCELARPDTSFVGTGGPTGNAAPGHGVHEWPVALPFTTAMRTTLVERFLQGDVLVVEALVDEYALSGLQKEIRLGFGIRGNQVNGNGRAQTVKMGALGGQSLPSAPSTGYEWLPIATEVNLHRGSASGSPSAAIAFASGLTETTLARTGPLPKASVMNNNGTGGWTNSGTGPQDVAGYHVEFSESDIVPTGGTMLAYTNGLSGDGMVSRAVLLEQPVGSTMPWDYTPGQGGYPSGTGTSVSGLGSRLMAQRLANQILLAQARLRMAGVTFTRLSMVQVESLVAHGDVARLTAELAILEALLG